MDERALAEAYERTVDEVYRYACRLTGGNPARAEDLTQDAYLALVREVRAGHIDVVSAAWLVTCVRNRFIDEVRRDDRGERNLRLVWSGPSEIPDERLPAMSTIDDVARAAIVLHHVDGYHVSDVAALIGKSVRATESLLARSRQTLRREMSRETSREMKGSRRHG
jgi:RNA polymerase sigma-70 factor (ECF subfamily)